MAVDRRPSLETIQEVVAEMRTMTTGYYGASIEALADRLEPRQLKRGDRVVGLYPGRVGRRGVIVSMLPDNECVIDWDEGGPARTIDKLEELDFES